MNVLVIEIIGWSRVTSTHENRGSKCIYICVCILSVERSKHPSPWNQTNLIVTVMGNLYHSVVRFTFGRSFIWHFVNSLTFADQIVLFNMRAI